MAHALSPYNRVDTETYRDNNVKDLDLIDVVFRQLKASKGYAVSPIIQASCKDMDQKPKNDAKSCALHVNNIVMPSTVYVYLNAQANINAKVLGQLILTYTNATFLIAFLDHLTTTQSTSPPFAHHYPIFSPP